MDSNTKVTICDLIKLAVLGLFDNYFVLLEQQVFSGASLFAFDRKVFKLC